MIGETLLSSAQVQPVLSAVPELQSQLKTFRPADGRETVPSITLVQ